MGLQVPAGAVHEIVTSLGAGSVQGDDLTQQPSSPQVIELLD